MSRRLLTCALLAPALALSVVPTVADAAARRPDLKVTSVSAPPAAQAGGTLAVRITVRNSGRATARASTTKVHLSVDARPGADLAVATVRTKKLKPGKRVTRTVVLPVPAGAAARGYRVLACADAKKKVKESKERNNCRLAKGVVTVTRPKPPTKPPVDPPPVDSRFPLTPDPLSVTPDPDESRAESQLVNPAADTTITATGQDGTTYSLFLPAGALIGLEEVTLTPLASVEGLPLSGGLAAAVELRPHGLDLLKPATLTIESPDLGPLAQQTPFYFHEGGADLHLYPVLPPQPGDDANTVRLPIEHFSTPGIGWGTPAERGGMQEHPPTRNQGQIASEISDLLRGERERDPNGDGPANPELGPEIESLMNEYYDGTLRPALQSAEDNPRALGLVRRSISDTLAWLRAMELYFGGEDGYSSARADDARARIERIMMAVSDDLWKRCSQEHDLDALPLLLTLARQAQLLGYVWHEEPEQRLKDCSRFELRFDSRIDFSGTWPVGGEQLAIYPHTGSGSWRARATTTNALGEDTAMTSTPLPLEEWAYEDSYSYPRSDGSTCSGGSHQVGMVPGTLTTAVLPRFQANPREVPPGDAAAEAWEEPPVDLVISATPTAVKDTVRTVGCDGSDTTSSGTSQWQSGFTSFHDGFSSVQLTGTEEDRAGDLMMTESWTDSRTVPNSLGSRTWTEATVLEVWHKPATG